LVVENLKSPVENGITKVQHCYTGDVDRPLPTEIAKCDANVNQK
jgi:hypothetical protein